MSKSDHSKRRFDRINDAWDGRVTRKHHLVSEREHIASELADATEIAAPANSLVRAGRVIIQPHVQRAVRMQREQERLAAIARRARVNYSLEDRFTYADELMNTSRKNVVSIEGAY